MSSRQHKARQKMFSLAKSRVSAVDKKSADSLFKKRRIEFDEFDDETDQANFFESADNDLDST